MSVRQMNVLLASVPKILSSGMAFFFHLGRSFTSIIVQNPVLCPRARGRNQVSHATGCCVSHFELQGRQPCRLHYANDPCHEEN